MLLPSIAAYVEKIPSTPDSLVTQVDKAAVVKGPKIKCDTWTYWKQPDFTMSFSALVH